ncbi:MAG: 6-hydroxycyclohex-1-ene-1-carbonyl-CoA dehydrogenase, partial [Fidelibacterota bacterium]
MDTISAWQMVNKGQSFKLTKRPLPSLEEGDALIKVSGCGVCHTDLSFWFYDVPTRHDLPLTLGHEISGIVLEGPSDLSGKPVIIPAVLPCGDCDLCRQNRSNICQHQKMPGNDFHGGFASHVIVPARFLIEVPEEPLQNHTLAELAVIADAVATPYQAMIKSGIRAGDFAVVIGVGGVGIYAVQLAKVSGAYVLALDIAQEKLDQLEQVGISQTLNTTGMNIRDIKKHVKEICGKMGAPANQWKIFEMSGTKAGQELAYALLGTAGTLSIVGFTMEKLEIRLSNLMAFDANV